MSEEQKYPEMVLLVDDDPDILSGFQRNLRKNFRIQTAPSGIDAIDVVKSSPPFAVVVTDYSMPGMNGIEFLSTIKKISPDTVRMLLTGYADLETSISAVNEGNIFRFLTKPVTTELLIQSIKNGIEQYRLVTGERELLDKTLKGSIKILIDILSTVNPTAFSQATNIRKISKSIADKIGIRSTWEVEVAALLSQIGCVLVPNEIIEKRNRNELLDAKEQKLLASHPQFGRDLLKNIPRFDAIANAIFFQNRCFDGSDNHEFPIKGLDIPIIGRILKVAVDFDSFVRTGKKSAEALEMMIQMSSLYDPAVLEALTNEFKVSYSGYVIRSVPFKKLRIGMLLADDIRDDRQFVLIAKGHEITDVHLMRLINISKFRSIIEPIKVYDTEQSEE